MPTIKEIPISSSSIKNEVYIDFPEPVLEQREGSSENYNRNICEKIMSILFQCHLCFNCFNKWRNAQNS